MREGYDGRLSPVDSTQAAVRYLKTLHGMFGGDWRLAVMAYNAGEYRVLQSMRRAGMNARNARPAELPGLSGITYAYVEKLHALACIFQQADDRDAWLKQMDRPVPRLAVHVLPGDATLEAWATRHHQPLALLTRLNPRSPVDSAVAPSRSGCWRRRTRARTRPPRRRHWPSPQTTLAPPEAPPRAHARIRSSVATRRGPSHVATDLRPSGFYS